MNRTLLAVVLLVVTGIVVVASIAMWVWATIPPSPDPETLPSHALELPSHGWVEAIREGRTQARALVSEEKLPGLSLAVTVEGELVWAEGFRWADMERQMPVTPGTLFRIGGVSETLTTAAVGLLVERGRIDLDAPVQRYLPGFPEKEEPISTRRLMAHAAGIRPIAGERESFRKWGCENDDERLAVFSDDPLRFPPGSAISRSAYGWVLVGAVVSAVAKQPYLDFVQREILTPLGMESTVPDLGDRIEAGRARFYWPRIALDPRYGLQDAPTVDLSCILPAAGFLSTPTDLVRFGSAMMDDTLLDPLTLEELLTPIALATGEPTAQALGWAVESVPLAVDATPTRIVSHGLGNPVRRKPLSARAVGGHVPGGTATLVILPEHDVAIAVATNVSGAENVSLLSIRLADVFVRAIATR